MSVNTAHCNDGISIYADERIIFKRPGVYLKFKGNDLPPAMKKETGGSMFLTQFRMIFLSEKSKGPLKSFSFPFHSVSDLDIKQPVFGANYITAFVRGEIDGGFEGNVRFDITFNDGGAIDFGTLLFKTVKKAQAQPRWVPVGPPSYFDIFGPVTDLGYPGPGYPDGYSPAPPSYGAPCGSGSGASAPPPAYDSAGPSNSVPNGAPPAYYSSDNPGQAMVPQSSATQQPSNIGFVPPPTYEQSESSKDK